MSKIRSLAISTSKKSQLLDITGKVADYVKASGVSSGVCYIFVPHTTAGVTINENADPDVRADIIKGLEHIVSDSLKYAHAEGNSPAHIKSSIIGNSLTIFIENNTLALGAWQAIYLCEFDGPRSRNVFIKVIKG